MPKRQIIKPIELEGLSDTGKETLRNDAYDRNKKSFVMGLILLLIFGGFGAHRFYLDKKWSAWLWPLIYFPISFGILFSSLNPIWGLLVFIAVLVEAMFLPRNVQLYNTALHEQLNTETSNNFLRTWHLLLGVLSHWANVRSCPQSGHDGDMSVNLCKPLQSSFVYLTCKLVKLTL